MCMKRLTTILVALGVLAWMPMQAQRYLEPVFDDVVVQTDITYGVNATVLLLPQLGEAVPQPLMMDVYMPAGDTETERPLCVIAHTGNFLPWPQNLSTTGTRKDSAIVYIAHQLARRGYVVALIDYRLGWNPIAPTQDERVFTLINAAYRGVQDLRTCIRYFRRTVAEEGNPYGIDPNKVMVWGDGTGGYITLAAATLDEYQEILIPKFVTQDANGNPVPMVIEQVNGDIYGTSVGIVPQGYPGFPPGDTLCYPNHVGYPSDFNLCVNMGGALGDTSWIDENTPPMISFQVPSDPFAPYMEGIVIVPGVNLPVVEVQGAYLVQMKANALGLNSVFADADFGINGYEDYSAVADNRNNGWDGLFPLYGSAGPTDSSPWQWWDAATNPNHNPDNPVHQDMSPQKGMSYCDTMIAYVAPRACMALGLNCPTVNVKELNEQEVGLQLGPNPATDFVRVTTNAEFPIQHIYVYDMAGRLVKAYTSLHTNDFTIQRNVLPAGMYVATFHFKEGRVTKQLLFN